MPQSVKILSTAQEGQSVLTELPSGTWAALAGATGRDKQLPRGLDAAFDYVVGLTKRLVPRQRMLLRRAALVDAMDKDFRDLADSRLREQAQDMRAIFRRGRDKPQDMLRAFALVREVCFRTVGMRPFVVQLAGGLGLADGSVVEMATGEGKTLTATLPATIFGWRGRSCHIVTVNDYLSQRDAEIMGAVYRFCGLSCGYVTGLMPHPQRRAAYQADITYTTNKEVCADYLRDQLALGRLRNVPSTILNRIVEGSSGGADKLLLRGLEMAIVDEADSILIDEAVTPLIISGSMPNTEQVEAFQQAVQIARQLSSGEHFRVNQRYREVDFTPAGQQRIEELAKDLGGIWAGARRREELVNQALVAHELYHKEKQYVIQEDKIVIVDEFTGRLMPDRTWRDGLHQAVEAKEQITVNPPKDTFARISFQRFFRLYRKLSGMTGTAFEARQELWQIYHLPVVVIPTNRPCARTNIRDRVFSSDNSKWQAVVEEIVAMHKLGRPVLVGTRSVRASEHLSELLTQRGLPHQVLNAVRHKEEAQIVAQAGQPAAITVATNMAGRGTDIKLGKGVAEIGGLHVIATERHEAGRIDRQLFGRCARQGDPGSTQAFVSIGDELPGRYAPVIAGHFRRTYGHKDAEITRRSTRWLFDMSQNRATRFALRQRKSVLQTDNWLDEFLGFAGKD